MHDSARYHSLALAHTLGLDDAERALIMSRDQLAGTDETLATPAPRNRRRIRVPSGIALILGKIRNQIAAAAFWSSK
jgi:hypothetical protein